MSFLRRILGGGPGPVGDHADPAAVDAEDAARDEEVLAEDAARVSDDLLARQLRYADRSWTPPAEGGTRRADDEDASARPA